LPIVHPGILPFAGAAPAATGANASPSAQRSEMINLITPIRIGDKGYLSMNGVMNERSLPAGANQARS
jgi:hypothetical protein